jgi:hypothetical protein
MPDASAPFRRTVTLHAPSGKPVLTVPVLPAAVVATTALALAPRITALAALIALLRKMSLSLGAAPSRPPAP